MSHESCSAATGSVSGNEGRMFFATAVALRPDWPLLAGGRRFVPMKGISQRLFDSSIGQT